MLKTSLAERLGRVSAEDADRREREEHRTIDRRMHILRGGPTPCGAAGFAETPPERALRRAGYSACPMLLRGLLPEPMLGAWCAMNWRRFGGTLGVPRRCGQWCRYEHTIVMAPVVRAWQSGELRCVDG